MDESIRPLGWQEQAHAEDFLETLRAHGLTGYALVGSAAWKEDAADIDYVVLSNVPQNLFEYLTGPLLGWENCDKLGAYDMSGEWWAVRKGNINLILTADAAWMQRMIQATEVCKYLRLAEKEARIAVNQIIRDGKIAEQFVPYRFVEMEELFTQVREGKKP